MSGLSRIQSADDELNARFILFYCWQSKVTKFREIE